MQTRYACCGINCRYCPSYQAHQNNTLAMLAKAAQHWQKRCGLKLNQSQVVCSGCQQKGPHTQFWHNCPVKNCQRNLKPGGCQSCNYLVCHQLAYLYRQNYVSTKALNRLQKKQPLPIINQPTKE